MVSQATAPETFEDSRQNELCQQEMMVKRP